MLPLPGASEDSGREPEVPHASVGANEGNSAKGGGGALGAPALGGDRGADRHHDDGPATSAPQRGSDYGVRSLTEFGNSVVRWHTIPHLRPQNLASHSWAVALIISRLFPGTAKDRLALIEAALEHDLVEAQIGDMPRPGRTQDHKDLETRVAKEMGLRSVPEKLRPWLEWADLIEAGLYAFREMKLGNQHFAEVSLRVADYLQRSEREIPRELWNFAKEAELV